MDRAHGEPADVPQGPQIRNRIPFQAPSTNREPIGSRVGYPGVVPAAGKARRIFVPPINGLQVFERHRPQPMSDVPVPGIKDRVKGDRNRQVGA
jgi:hypothetical protein